MAAGRSNAWRRNAIVVASLLALGACTGSPYRNRVLPDGLGGEKEYFFAYGRFCGAGYPPLHGKTGDEAARALTAAWPPMDDLDAMCYAHDHCLLQTYPDADDCDGAFMELLIDESTTFAAEGCWNLVDDMSTGMFSRGSDPASGAFGWFSVGFFQTLKAPMRPFLKHPVEGTCNLGTSPDPAQVIEMYEQAYRDEVNFMRFLYQPRVEAVEIPLPTTGDTR